MLIRLPRRGIVRLLNILGDFSPTTKTVRELSQWPRVMTCILFDSILWFDVGQLVELPKLGKALLPAKVGGL